MANFSRVVQKTERILFTSKELEDMVRKMAVNYKGPEWERANVSVYTRQVPATMGQIEYDYEIVAECSLVTVKED